MQNLPIPVPSVGISRRLQTILWQSFVTKGVGSDDEIELIIAIDDRDINLRDLGAYLSLLDRFYGRLDPLGYISYSLSPLRQLEISEIRSGSWDIVFYGPPNLIFLYLLVKSLPHAAKELAGAYKLVEEGRLARAERLQIEQRSTFDHERRSRLSQRRELRNALRSYPQLQNLSRKDIAEVAAKIGDQYTKEPDHNLKRGARFSENHVNDIILRIRKK